MRYKSIDGAIFEADAPEELLTALREVSWNPGESLAEFMDSTARAAKMQTGREHCSGSAAALVADLEASGLLVPVLIPAAHA